MSRRKRAPPKAAPRRKRPSSKRPPPNPAPRRVKLSKPTKEEIERLRPDAYALIDFPELLDQPKWKLAALLIAQAFIAQNPYPPLGPRAIAALVDQSVDYQLEQGMPLAEAVKKARDAYAELLRKKRDTIRRAHQRYGEA